MRILGLIPARGGSKRLPGKNLRLLGGLPLIAWTIQAARDSGCLTEILVSTDDEAIADVARTHGAHVPWLRPADLADDVAGSADMAIHAIDAYQAEHGAIDGLMLLQPTSPFRAPDAIARAIDLFSQADGKHPVVSVSPASSHPAWSFRLSQDNLDPFLGWQAIGQRSQEQEPAWALNGSIYLISPDRLRQERSFLCPDARALTMENPGEDLDIDTALDFFLCEKMLELRNRPNEAV